MGRKYDTITVKKYANRRLYDTSKSTYITLQDIAEMIHEGLDFVVVDAKSNEDLTHSVLAQIVLDNESQNPRMFPTDFMRKLIGMYGNNMQAFVPGFLSQAMDMMVANQEKLQNQVQDSMGTIFPNAQQIGDMNKRNIEVFQNAMQMFNPLSYVADNEEVSKKASNGNKDARIAELEAQIKELKEALGDKS